MSAPLQDLFGDPIHVWVYTTDGATRMASRRYRCTEHSLDAMALVDWEEVWMRRPVLKFGGWIVGMVVNPPWKPFT
jgi:hypothetical protein